MLLQMHSYPISCFYTCNVTRKFNISFRPGMPMFRLCLLDAKVSFIQVQPCAERYIWHTRPPK